MSDNYTPYHLHSHSSNPTAGTGADSVTKFIQYLDKAEEYGMDSFAFSEHGNMFEWTRKKEEIEKRNMKFIGANEVYLTQHIDKEKGLIRDNYHYMLIAKNWEGMKELNKLTSASFEKEDGHFYYNPRLSFDELKNTSDNILMTSACLASPLWRLYKKAHHSSHEEDKQAKKELMSMLDFINSNKHRMFFEIQYHDHPEQIEYNRLLLNWSKEMNIPLIAAGDTHSLNREHAEVRNTFLKSKGASYGDEDKFDLTFKPYDEFVDMFEKQGALPRNVYLEAIHNTNVMADMVETFDLDNKPKYPRLYDDSENELKERIRVGVKERGVNKLPADQKKEYFKRINDEYDTYKELDAIDYMLLQDDIIKWCHENNIYQGYSRGSVSGSLIAYLLGVTEVDSIKWNMNFTRFLNKDRVTLADIDVDFPPSRRQEVIDYIASIKGVEFCEIITFNTMALRGAIENVGRAFKIPLDEVDRIKDLADENYEEFKKKYPEVEKNVKVMNGVYESIGSHPSGFVVSPVSLSETVGLCKTKESKYVVSQINMKELEKLNFVKLDVLGLDNMEIINQACELAGIERLTPDNMDFEDEEVWKSMKDDTVGIFQWESGSAQRFIKDLFSEETLNNIKDSGINSSFLDLLSIGNGAIRPAGDSYRDKLSKGIPEDNEHNALNDFLSSTLGQLIYQEQIMEFLVKFCGFTMGESDVIRRCLHEDTEVLLANGNKKKIKDINVGENVIAFDKNGISQIRNITNVFNNGVKKVRKISTEHGYELKATDNHEFLTINGFKPLSELRVGDYVMTPSRLISEGDQLRPNQRLTSEDMLLIGMLIGDGTLYEYDKDGYLRKPKFTNSDKEIIEAYKRCVNKRGLKGEAEFNINEVSGVTVDKIYSVTIRSNNYNKSVCNLLKKYDLLKKAADKSIPNEFMLYPNGEKIQNLLGGLFTTDGGSFRDYIDYSTTSKKLAEQIKSLLLRYDIYSYVSKRYIKDYDYYLYRLYINHIDSLVNFERHILPFMHGDKVNKFTNVISNAKTNNKRYNYLLPKECREEIRNASVSQRKSIRSIGETIGGYSSSGFVLRERDGDLTDTKAKKLITELYCPKTYWLLSNELLPVKITNIEDDGIANTYDLEVEHDHNYVANDIVVHNCIAKKTDDMDYYIPKIKEGFVKTMIDKFGETKEHAEHIIERFLEVIINSSNYGFSSNHSYPYSMIGYANAWLRHHYPLEFITAFINVREKKEERIAAITDYAKRHNVKFYPIRFGKSRGKYNLNKAENSIYKGLGSIKHISHRSAEELYQLAQSKEYDKNNFVGLLVDIFDKTSVASDQMEILIRLDYFKDFGEKEILLEIYQSMADKKKANFELYPEFKDYIEVVKGEEKIKKIPLKYDSKHKDNTKQQRLSNLYRYEKLVKERPPRKFTPYENVTFEKDMLGYAETTMDVPNSHVIILSIDTKYTPRIVCYQPRTGREITVKIKKRTFFSNSGELCSVGDYVEITSTFTDGRWVKKPNPKEGEFPLYQDQSQQELFIGSLRHIK